MEQFEENEEKRRSRRSKKKAREGSEFRLRRRPREKAGRAGEGLLHFLRRLYDSSGKQTCFFSMYVVLCRRQHILFYSLYLHVFPSLSALRT